MANAPNHRLIAARLAHGLSQRELAEKIGVSASSVARWESGTIPYEHHQNKLVTIFGTSVQELGFTSAVLNAAEQIEPTSGAWSGWESSLPSINREQPLVGREQEIRALRRSLLNGAPVISITGLPGVGKTTLALAVASHPQVHAHFQGRVLWAGLGYKPPLPDVLSRWGKLLGLSIRQLASLSGDKRAEALHTIIGKQTCLIVLDDIWDSSDVDLLWKVGGTRCSYLLTTRFPKVASELARGASITVLRELDETQGYSLLRLLAPQAAKIEPKRVQELVQAAGGLPLALTLMGYYLNQQTIAGQERRVVAAVDSLADARQRLHLSASPFSFAGRLSESDTAVLSLERVLAFTEQILDESTRSALYALSLLLPKPRSFAETTAMAVAACDIDTLDRLVDLGLLEYEGHERYQIHPAIADYGRLQIAPAQKMAAYERLLAFLDGELEQGMNSARLETMNATIMTALDVAYEIPKPEALFKMILLIAPFWMAEGWYSLTELHIQRAVTLARQDEKASSVLPRLLALSGAVSLRFAQYTQAFALYQEGLDVARQVQDELCECEILTTLSWLTLIYGYYDQVDAYVQAGLSLAVKLATPAMHAALLKTQGTYAFARGDYHQAEQLYQQGLCMLQALPEQQKSDTGSFFCFLAEIESARGHYDRAAEYFEMAMSALELYGPKALVSYVITQQVVMESAFRSREAFPALRASLQDALQQAQEFGGMAYAPYTYRADAFLALELGLIEEATQLALRGIEVAEQFNENIRKSELLSLLGYISLVAGRLDEAANYVEQAIPLVRRYGLAVDQAYTQGIIGELALCEERIEDAEQAFSTMQKIAPPEHRLLAAFCHYGLARVAAARRNRRHARQHGEGSLHILNDLHHPKASKVSTWLAQIPSPAPLLMKKLMAHGRAIVLFLKGVSQ